jgi:hypothetical protein
VNKNYRPKEKNARVRAYETGGGFTGCAGGGITRGTGVFFSVGAALDLALAAKARANARAEMSDLESMITNKEN